jgi:gamma-glutamylcyclotransferase (GGCT)/AIG2-like uncharacterized protein YtfP
MARDRAQPAMKLFVYGTLCEGQRAHHLLRSAPLLARTRTAPTFRLVDMGGYPALVRGGTTAVYGEIYEVDDSLIPELDRYEDVPELYQRETLEVGGMTAWAYVLPEPFAAGRPELPTGDWRDRAG